MIGRIAGHLIYRETDHILVDVRGVGYLVYCSDRTMAALPPLGGTVALFTDLLVREDNLQLFGFSSRTEKEWHRLLISVQGVGAKAALAIAGTLGPDGVSRAIALGDVTAIKAAPGVGPKLAQRIATELKDKAPAMMARSGDADASTGLSVADPEPSDDSVIETPVAAPSSSAQADALSALVNLGYPHGDAAAALAAIEGDLDAPALIKAALRRLAPKE